MKKYLMFAMFVVLAVALVSPVSVLAKTKAGAKPGSFFYFFDKAFERADLFFTFNPEKKAKKALENADERLAEAEESASENDQKAVETAMKNYQENISLAETEVKLVKDETKTKELLSTIASSTLSHQEVLEKVLNKIPEEVKEAIQKAFEASKKREEKADEKTTEPKKEVSEIKQEIKETNDEPKNKKDEQKKEIEKLKKEVEGLKQKQIMPKQPTLEIQNSQEQKKTEEVRNNAEETTKKLATENLQKKQEEAKIKAEQERLREVQKLADQRVAEEKQKELERQQQLENQRLAEEKAKAEEVGTKVQGVISQNTIWTIQNSPYIVVDNILIESGILLTLEKGVEVKFNQDKFIQVMGDLQAIGTKENPIVFTANITNLAMGIWGPVKIGMSGNDRNGGNINLEYCKIEYSKGISVEAQVSSTNNFNNFTIKNCIFEKNTFGIYAHRPGPNSYIKNNIFTDNDVAVYMGWDIKYVQNPKNIDVIYNIFKNNNIGLQIASYGGIPSDPENHSMLHVGWNTFLQNQKYNLEMKYKDDINFSNNWWGTANSSIIDSKIYDYSDNFEKGKAIYQPFATSEILDAGVQ